MEIGWKKIILTALTTVLLAVSVTAAQTNLVANTETASVKGLVNLEDLLKMDFATPKVQPPTEDGNYPAKASYFWVGASGKPSPVNNLVMISAMTLPAGVHTLFNYGSSQKDFTVDGGMGKEATLIGTRTAINFIKHGTYVVVIGPSAAEVEALAVIVASKIE